MSDPVFLVAAALFGATLGSYLNVVIYRLPRPDRDVMGLRSACPACGKTIPLYLNVPIASWFFLRGRTRCCGKPLSWRYPLVESITAGLFAMLALWPPSGLPLHAADFQVRSAGAFALHGFFAANLVANTFIDLDFRILPDVLTRSMMVVGVLGALLLPGFAGPDLGGIFAGMATVALAANSLMFSLFGLGVGYLTTWTVRKIGRIAFRKDAMGAGDVKLMAGVGAFLGWQGALLTFFLGCVVGAVAGLILKVITRDSYIAFGPYLALGAVVTLFLREPMIKFLTVSWPQWQRQNASSPWVLVGLGLLCLFLLVHLVRRGRAQ